MKPPTVPNPSRPRSLKPAHLITDRAKRYRANAAPPPGPKACAYCGSRRNLDIDHQDGNEANGRPENLQWLCRSHNAWKGALFARMGKGVITRQYNPEKGATTLAQWIRAVNSICRRRDEKKGDCTRSSDVETMAAVNLIRATPHSRRAEFAAAQRSRRSFYK